MDPLPEFQVDWSTDDLVKFRESTFCALDFEPLFPQRGRKIDHWTGRNRNFGYLFLNTCC
jgi:hypothetical protein